MVEGVAFALPEIAEAAIPWVCGVLGLPATAFSGPNGQDPRLPVLKSLATLDIEACPGSGKTTLLVAKLAILGGLWAEPRRGLCVLSHTNVARREIEHKLGSTAEGQRLLSYPHFIGTIHGFVNEFLAIPWLRSNGYSVEMIDDEVAQRRRWQKLPRQIQGGLEKNNYDQIILRMQDVQFGVGEIHWGKARKPLGKDTPTYQALVNACRESAQEGYFCHDEMFIWANDLLNKTPEVTSFLRARFPLLFIDEVQDNSELQSKLLYRVFTEGNCPVIRQRHGDANQAIYQNARQTKGAVTDPFPQLAVRTDIPNSFRFGQEIADLADPLALEPQGLQGRCQDSTQAESDTSGKHAIFLFDDESIGNVLENYAAYLVDVFSGNELRDGNFTAVGAVHRPVADDNLPRHVGHYWPDYDYEIGRADPQPQTFVQYVSAGRRLSQDSGETHAVVEKIAEAVIRLARIADPAFSAGKRIRKHRYLLELLKGKDAAKTAYIDMVRTLAADRVTLTENGWNDNWRQTATQIAQDLIGAAVGGDDVTTFLAWGNARVAAAGEEQRSRSDNIFRYPRDNPSVAIRVGSIHAAKGETHTATLVLETFYYGHHLKALKPWLLGDRSGMDGASLRLQARLKLHYVAMTRPARLVCLAMRHDSVDDNETTKLRGHGWRIARVTAHGPEWVG